MRITAQPTEGFFALGVQASNLGLSIHQRYSRWWMTCLLALSDLGGLLLSCSLAVGLRATLWNDLQDPQTYLRFTPLLGLFFISYASRGLYPGVGLSPVEEMRRLTISTSIVFLIIAAVSAFTHTAGSYSRLIFFLAWFFSLIFVQLGRWLLRLVAVRCALWGEPVAVVGYGPQGQKVVQYLLKNMHMGLRPVLVIDGLGQDKDLAAPVPKLRLDETGANTTPLRFAGIHTAILVITEMPLSLQDDIVDQQSFGFKRLILISNMSWVGSVGITPYDLEGILGLEVRRNLLDPWQQTCKRLLDLVAVLVGGTLFLPILAAIALLVRLDSPGSPFYGHRRIGKRGENFKTWKFRTMISGADRVLQDYLAGNPASRKEWEATQKLKNDPRVTRIGCLLRKLSLDELPQLWNVLKGEMSLVGPRPIVDDEVRHYSEGYKLYTQVTPGITGLWQVSGRSDTGYIDRVRLDEYYVRNWSIWLDIYILIRTIWVVLRRDGAY